MHPEDATVRIDLEVRSPEGAVLLPAGTLVTPTVLAEVAAAGRAHPLKTHALLDHESVRRDLARSVHRGQYLAVFGSPEEYRDLERLMGTVLLPEFCLRGLDWFRDHDYATYRHILMVFGLSCLLTQEIGRGTAEAAAGVAAGPLHDFGKLSVPRTILGKTTPLTRAERALLEQHTLAGHLLLAHAFGDPGHYTARVARDHHERRDGSGYPRHVPLADQLVEIVAVCDIFDALVSPRPYRESPYDTRTALEEITRLAVVGKVGWETVRLLVSRHRRDRPDPAKVDISLAQRGRPPAANVYGVFED